MPSPQPPARGRFAAQPRALPDGPPRWDQLVAAASGCRRRTGLGLLTLLTLATAVLAPGASAAPNPAPTRPAPSDPNQPYAINQQGLLPRACPLIVPGELPALQPIRIQPSQVAAKNRLGCLSAADAIYGPDGCPQKLCPAGSGSMALPKGL